MKLSKHLIIDDIPFIGYWSGTHCKISDGVLTIYEGFTWDGMTIVRDGKKNDEGYPLTWKASCLHDVLYQEFNLPLSRTRVDKLFLKELRETNFMCAYLYYLGVRALGWLFWRN